MFFEPNKTKNETMQHMTMRISKSTLEDLKKIASKEQWMISEMVRRACEAYVHEYKMDRGKQTSFL
jgi:hypothetical protein